MKEAKVENLHNQAVLAASQGQVVFTPMLNSPWWKTGFSGAITDWALMIEGVERAGWRLEHWAIGQDQRGQPQAYPVFRRHNW